MTKVTGCSCWHQNFVSKGLSALPRGYIWYEKMCIKSDFEFMYLVVSLVVLRAGCGIWLYQFLIIAYIFTFQIDVFETCSKRLKWQEISVDIKNLSPGGCPPLSCGYIHLQYSIMKRCPWSQRLNKWPKWWGLPVDIKMLALMYCLPPPKGYIHVEKHEKVCIKSVIKVIRPFCFHQQNCPQGLSHLALGLDTLYTCMN